MGRLGCGEWRAVLQCRGGGALVDLPFAQLGMSRRLDDMSDASVTVTGKAMDAMPERQRTRCRGYLAELNPWEHELALWRGDEQAWAGPVLTPSWGPDSVTIPARDLFQWFERRLLETDRNFVGEDLARVFHRYAVDALKRDPTPNIALQVTDSGVTGDRSVLAAARRRAADELRELARTGVDFTMLGRTLVVGGPELTGATLGPLVAEHFTEGYPRLSLDGLNTATEATVVGRSSGTSSPVVGRAGGVDQAIGLLQDVSNESSIEDDVSAGAAAQTRLDMLGDTPQYVEGQLAALAPVAFEDLVPGSRADLRLALFCRDVIGTYRLTDVGASVAVSGDVVQETVSVRFVTLGTAEEAA